MVTAVVVVSNVLPALWDCPRLEELSLQGCAVLDEDSLRLAFSSVCLLVVVVVVVAVRMA